jgi:hypothetical protein
MPSIGILEISITTFRRSFAMMHERRCSSTADDGIAAPDGLCHAPMGAWNRTLMTLLHPPN